MSIYVFTGPTLSAEEGRAEVEAVYLPPASQGDVYRVARKQPRAIGIIDGYFERVPAIWHKEILWAMSQGIHVYGSSSMGALRAAELEQFGMVGVGAVFEAYRDGIIEDDDEVAVAHAPVEMAYRPTSEAMVNIRFTIAHAVAEKVVCPATGEALLRIAKSLFYPERSYPQLLELAFEAGLPSRELSALRSWLPQGQINQKREDAITMLRMLLENDAGHELPKEVLYSFEHTEMWDHAARVAGQQIDSDSGADVVHLDSLLDELRIDGNAYLSARQATMLRSLAFEEAGRLGLGVSAETARETAEEFRRERGLSQPGDFERWLDENRLDRRRFVRLIEEEARLKWVQAVYQREFMTCLPNHLRTTGAYRRLLARALDKQRALESMGLENPALADAEVTGDELLQWYFEQHLGRQVVDDVAGYALSVGFPDEDAFRRALLREFCYSARNFRHKTESAG